MKLEFVQVKSITLVSTPGAPLGECIREALRVAVERWENVELLHNGKVIEIKVNDLFAQAKET